ncbi:hypothetical protein KH5_24080 [Urechidicola sp. KH5]
MTHEQLSELLENKVSAYRVHRDQVADTVLDNLESLPHLLNITFDPTNPLAFHAAWVLEYVFNRDLNQLLPYLDILQLTSLE